MSPSGKSGAEQSERAAFHSPRSGSRRRSMRWPCREVSLKCSELESTASGWRSKARWAGKVLECCPRLFMHLIAGS